MARRTFSLSFSCMCGASCDIHVYSRTCLQACPLILMLALDAIPPETPENCSEALVGTSPNTPQFVPPRSFLSRLPQQMTALPPMYSFRTLPSAFPPFISIRPAFCYPPFLSSFFNFSQGFFLSMTDPRPLVSRTMFTPPAS